LELANKVAVVTGAASGIGLGLVERLLDEGMSVAMADVELGALEAAAEPLLAQGLPVLPVQTDVSDADAVDRLAERTVDAFGAVHVVCNNAGVTTNGRAWELGLEDWRWVIDVNLWGVIHGIRTFVPLLVEQGEGHVVNTSSMAGVGILNNLAPYLASKHAVTAMSEGLAAELAEAGSSVGVSVLCPGAVRTKILSSARNREPGVGPGQQVPAEVVELIDQGLEPSAVAGMVVDAVQHQRFWIFTHPGMLGLVERRMRGMLDARH
jgi:NAD(P)-dependent dehydrogenase (short-subunit alcohol dehydrogenase family)